MAGPSPSETGRNISLFEARRGFLKKSGELILAAVVADVLGSCAPRERNERFVYSIQDAGRGPGFATADLSEAHPEIYLAGDAPAAGDMERAFRSDKSIPGSLQSFISETAYRTNINSSFLVDHDTAAEILKYHVIIYDARIDTHGGRWLLRVGGMAPVMIDGKPSKTERTETVFAVAVDSHGPWIHSLAPSPLGDPKLTSHVADIMRTMENHIARNNFLTPEINMTAAAVAPGRYAEEIMDSLGRYGLVNTLNDLRSVVPIQELYVPTYNADGILVKGIFPTGLQVGINAFRQLPDGRVLVLVTPQQETYLRGKDPLTDDAKFHVPKTPLWMDVTDLWMKTEETDMGEVEEASISQVTSTRQMTLLQDELATLYPPTQTSLPTPTHVSATETPMPTYTPRPTMQSFAGFETAAATKSPQPVIPESNSMLYPILCGVSGLAAAGGVGWVVWDFIRGTLQEKIDRENSEQRFRPK